MGLIPNEIISAVLERSDIAAVIGRYVLLKKAGRNFKALCPFHNEKSPSFVVNPDKQIFHCFGCHAGGNAIGFVMRQERLEFPQAVRLLADQCGITVPEESSQDNSHSRQLRDDIYKVNELAVGYFHENLLTGKDEAVKGAREYLKNRGVNLEVVRKFSLGFAANEWDGLINFLKNKNINVELMEQAGLVIAREGKKGFYDRFRNRVIFPIFDIQSRPIAFGARAMTNEDGAKYINSPETLVYTKGRHLFGFNLTKTAAGKLDQVIVVEGYMDMIMPFVHEVPNIAASQGTALTVEQIRLIRRYTSNVVMLFDTDPAGQNAIIRSLDLLVEEGMNVRVVTLLDGEDPDSFIRAHGINEFRKRLEQAHSLFDFKYGWISKQLETTTPEGKSLLRQAMLDTINRYRDDVVKFELKKKLAERINIPIDVPEKNALKVEIKDNPPVRRPSVNLDRGEEILLALFLNDSKWIFKAKEVLDPFDFSEGMTREIAVKVWQIRGENSEWNAQELLAQCDDEISQSFIVGLISKEDQWFGDKEKVFKDCAEKIRKKKLDQQLLDAKREGNVQLMNELIKQKKN